MKFGFRIPSLKKRISARISPKRYLRHNLGLKAPKGYGWLTDPKKAAYNRVYNRTTYGIDEVMRPKRRYGFPLGRIFIMGVIAYLVLKLAGC